MTVGAVTNTILGGYHQGPLTGGVIRAHLPGYSAIKSLALAYNYFSRTVSEVRLLSNLSDKKAVYERCFSHLIRMIGRGALCNTTSEFQITLLQLAARSERWPLCRALLDAGICQSSNKDQMNAVLGEIRDRLAKHVKPAGVRGFMYQRSQPNRLEMFVEEKHCFIPLQSIAGGVWVEKPIALFILQSEGALGKNVGAIARHWGDAAHSWYEEIAKNFTTVRGSIDDKTELVPMIKQVKDRFPGVPLLVVALVGHANPDVIEVSKDSILTHQDVPIFQEVGKHIHPAGELILAGCSTSKGKLITVASESMPGRKVYGAPYNYNRFSYRISTPQSASPKKGVIADRRLSSYPFCQKASSCPFFKVSQLVPLFFNQPSPFDPSSYQLGPCTEKVVGKSREFNDGKLVKKRARVLNAQDVVI